MNRIVTLFKQANNKLSKAYGAGHIVYPRVENNYIEDLNRLYEAHPPLTTFDRFSEPLFFPVYDLSFNTLPLALANKRISTPATSLRILEYLGGIYDDNLDPYLGKENYIKDTVSRVESHIPAILSLEQYKDTEVKSNYDFINNVCGDFLTRRYTPKKRDFNIYRITLEPRLVKRLKTNVKSKKTYRRDSTSNFMISDDGSKKANKAQALITQDIIQMSSVAQAISNIKQKIRDKINMLIERDKRREGITI